PQLLGHRGVLREGGPPFRRRMARGRILAIVSSAAPVTAVRATPAFLAARGATPKRAAAAGVLASLPVPAMGAPALRAAGRLRSPVSAGSGLPVVLSRPGIRLSGLLTTPATGTAALPRAALPRGSLSGASLPGASLPG